LNYIYKTIRIKNIAQSCKNSKIRMIKLVLYVSCMPFYRDDYP
jgi:hypothetical protein